MNINEFETPRDYGYEISSNVDNKVRFIKCDDPNFTQRNGETVISNGDLTPGKFFNLDEILSGGSLNIPLEDTRSKDQAELAIDYSLATSLAYLGSVYSTVQISINNIRENYPNGFLIVDAITGVNSLMFNASDTYMYGGEPFRFINYLDYEIVQSYNGVYDTTFTITDYQTGFTYALFLNLNGQPQSGSGWDHSIQPTIETIDRFYSTLNHYEKDLLVPPSNRINFWPRDLVATNNLLYDGERYTEFVETELNFGNNADAEESNFIWRKLYPDGQKVLDSEDGLMQKMVLSFAMNFDKIKRYQDHLKYQHTIGYDANNHISKDLVELLATQWNWSLGHNLNQDDYSKYIYSTYENYITGQSQQKLSSRDVNFEIWRRVLSNLVTLYKKKGTKEAIKYVTNIYGLPEELLWIDELVEIQSENRRGRFGKNYNLIESESNIIVPMSGQSWYIDDVGSATTLTYEPLGNTKYLNVNISPFDAIEFDFYDWGWENHPDITNVNSATAKISGTTEITKRDFFNKVYKNTIKSDGSARYESSYPLLEGEGSIYYDNSPNQMNLATLDPYMDFLDENWNILISNLVPASSKLVSVGTLYRNPMWRREKYTWNDSELDPKALPLNETITIDVPNFAATIKIAEPANIVINETVGFKEQKKFVSIDLPQISASKKQKMVVEFSQMERSITFLKTHHGYIQSDNTHGSIIEPMVDNVSLVFTAHSGTSYNITSPLLEPISGQFGSLLYVDYDEDSIVVTNQNTFDIIMSASNLSDSGYTKFEFDLYRKLYNKPMVIHSGKTYSIMSTLSETPKYGTYRVSSLSGVDTYDYIFVSSPNNPNINRTVQILYIDTGTSQIRTMPSINLLDTIHDTNTKTKKQPATFNRLINFFDWSSPIQRKEYANFTIDSGDFNLPTIDTEARTSGNQFSTTGTVTFGGLDYLNSDLLKDKEEYFYRYRAITHAPKEWEDVSGLDIFPSTSGGSLLESGYDTQLINGIKYQGRYFMYMKTPNRPISNIENVLVDDSVPVTTDSSSIVKWNGVGDSDRLEVQYLSVSSSTEYGSYSAIPFSAWTEKSVVKIDVEARENVGDEYIYTIQTTLEPDTYYWWRVKNFRNKINLFGNNLECFTPTQPSLMLTGAFADGGKDEGEIPVIPRPPIKPDNPTLDN